MTVCLYVRVQAQRDSFGDHLARQRACAARVGADATPDQPPLAATERTGRRRPLFEG